MIRTYFSDFQNFGDALNRPLIACIGNGGVERVDYAHAELMAVGSIFYGGGFFWGNHGRLLSKERFRYWFRRSRDVFQPVLNVWGSGVLFDLPTPPKCVHYRKMNICAVRGKETVRILKRAGFLQGGDDPALGDPGLLYPHLIPEVSNSSKLYDLAIVPHYLDYEIGLNLGRRLKERGVNVKVVDVMQPDSLNVIREIASARKIASASLHGLIVSDSMGIPNRHLVLSDYEVDRHHGEGAFMLKFKDYYSALDVEPRDYLTEKDFDGNTEFAIDSIVSPAAESDKIRRVKIWLLDAFPAHLRGAGWNRMREEILAR